MRRPRPVAWLLGRLLGEGVPVVAPPSGHPMLALPAPAPYPRFAPLNLTTCGQCGGPAATGYACAGCGWPHGPATPAQLDAQPAAGDE